MIGINLGYRIALTLILEPESFRVELFGVILEEHIILMDPNFDVFQVPDILILK